MPAVNAVPAPTPIRTDRYHREMLRFFLEHPHPQAARRV